MISYRVTFGMLSPSIWNARGALNSAVTWRPVRYTAYFFMLSPLPCFTFKNWKIARKRLRLCSTTEVTYRGFIVRLCFGAILYPPPKYDPNITGAIQTFLNSCRTPSTVMTASTGLYWPSTPFSATIP